MYLTVVMLSKHLETSNELDWDWFCETNQGFLKNVQEHEIFQNSFFTKENGRIKVVYYNNDLQNGFKKYSWAIIWSCFEKWFSFGKW